MGGGGRGAETKMRVACLEKNTLFLIKASCACSDKLPNIVVAA